MAEDGARGEATIIAEFDEEIPDYPMLSRISGEYYDAVFEKDEVEPLRGECLRAKSSTTNLLPLIENLSHDVDASRRVNSGVRLLLCIKVDWEGNCHE
jgi:hypothetical protein